MTTIARENAVQAGAPARPIRVAMCWHSVSGYMAACWRALAATPGIDLLVVTQAPDPGGATPFDPALMAGVRHAFVAPDAMGRPDGMRSAVVEFAPDALVTGGWFIPACNGLVAEPALRNALKVNAIDRPRQGTWRDWQRRLTRGRFMRSFDLVFVPGERAYQYARFLGIPDQRIRRGAYGVDFRALAPLWDRRASAPGGWPRSFLFMGRYAPEKGLDILVEAYKRYRALAREPWPLVCCGRGELGGLFRGVPGIEDRGFVQPAAQLGVLERQGVLVMASRFDPWPLALAEGSAAGLPVVCTVACGSGVELVRPYVSGLLAADGSAEDLSLRMLWMHEHHGRLASMGRAARDAASAYSAEAWAERWSEALRETLARREPGTRP